MLSSKDRFDKVDTEALSESSDTAGDKDIVIKIKTGEIAQKLTLWVEQTSLYFDKYSFTAYFRALCNIWCANVKEPRCKQSKENYLKSIAINCGMRKIVSYHLSSVDN